MSFVNASLLLGAALIAAPIVLHLLMRRQPKRLVFPAIRFIKPRVESNQRTLQLRHWLLLVLRCGLIVVLAIAFARPNIEVARIGQSLVVISAVIGALVMAALLLLAIQRKVGRGATFAIGALLAISALTAIVGMVQLVASSTGTIVGGQEAPVAAVIVVDTAPRMLYRHQNRTRLEVAQESAKALLSRLPTESQVSIADTGLGQLAFSADRSAAERAIERLQPTYASRAIPEVVRDSLRLLQTSAHQRRELYVVSDLTIAAWEAAATSDADMKDLKGVQLYMVDIGVVQPSNFGLGELRSSDQRISQGSEWTISTDVTSDSLEQEIMVELYLRQPDVTRPIVVDRKLINPDSIRRDRQTVRVTPGAAQSASFSLRGLDPGFHHGSVRLVSEDGLSVDDERFFSVEVRDAWPILVVTGSDATDSNVTNALVPSVVRSSDDARFAIRRIEQSGLPNVSLDDFDAVVLLDPAPFGPDTEERLIKFATDGGGVAVFLGHNATSGFSSDQVKQLIGCRIARQWRASDRELHMAPDDYQHSVLREFHGMETTVPWSDFPVFRFCELVDFSPTSSVVCGFSNNQPAVVENKTGQGRVLTMSTPVSELPQTKGRAVWNELFASDAPWPAFVLVNEMVLHLVERNVARINFVSGETVTLPNDLERDPDRYQFFTPKDLPTDVVAGGNRLALGKLENPGVYYLRGKRTEVVQRGLSVNVAANATQLRRLAPEGLEKIFGKDRYRLARSADELVRDVGEARIGREFYPYVMLAIAFLLACEHLLANRFYRREPTSVADTQVELLQRRSA